MNLSIKPRNKNIFNESGCTRCGECFHLCPELSLPIDVAKQEIVNLIEGKESKHVLAHCTTCRSCNHLCPYDCKPYQLILERWNDLYKKRGAPAIYRFVCPTMDQNIWHMLSALMTPEETEWTKQWMAQEPRNTVILVGNYVHLLPFVVGGSKLLDFFTPVDLLDHWECGAYLYQAGYLDVVKDIAEKCKLDFMAGNVKTIVPLIDAVHWMMTDVFPKELNVTHDLEIVNFHVWLLESIDNGQIQLPNKLGLKVTVHDNCYSKAGGGQYWDPPRELLQRAGCEIIEMEHIRENSLCCGFGAGASWLRPLTILFDIMDVARKKIEEAEATGADALVSYCGGCLYLLWAARELFESKIDIFHLVEVQRMAMGERLDYPAAHVRRAWDIIAIMTIHLMMSLVGRCFWIDAITMESQQWKGRRFTLLKVLRKLLEFRVAQALHKKIFRIMVPLLKARRHF